MFIKINGGIVLGDKENHIPIFHAPQVIFLILDFIYVRICISFFTYKFIRTYLIVKNLLLNNFKQIINSYLHYDLNDNRINCL